MTPTIAAVIAFSGIGKRKFAVRGFNERAADENKEKARQEVKKVTIAAPAKAEAN